MSNRFPAIAAALLLSCLAVPAFAQTATPATTGNGMSHSAMSSNSMAHPSAMAPAGTHTDSMGHNSMAPAKSDTGMSHNAMAPDAMGGSMSKSQ